MSLRKMYNRFFQKKRHVPFASLKQINDNLERLEKVGVLSKVDNSDRTSTLYINKKSLVIRVYADFYPGLNDALKSYHYPLWGMEVVFVQLCED